MFLRVHHISKYYGEGTNRRAVLNNVNFSVNKGSVCVIMGSSGSGKSTLLHCIGGLEQTDAGHILVDGHDISGMNRHRLQKYRRSSLGFVFQFYNLIPCLTVAENIDVCRYLSAAPLDRDELLQILGLEDKRDSFPNTLSGGEQQRCAIARAVVKNPRLLLCDEPTGALDSKTSIEILALLEKINQIYGTTVLMVTHNSAIKPMADQIITLQDGIVTDDYLNTYKIPARELEGI